MLAALVYHQHSDTSEVYLLPHRSFGRDIPKVRVGVVVPRERYEATRSSFAYLGTRQVWHVMWAKRCFFLIVASTNTNLCRLGTVSNPGILNPQRCISRILDDESWYLFKLSPRNQWSRQL
jgi:hypothetical protein